MGVLVKGYSYTLVRNAEKMMIRVRLPILRGEVEISTKLRNKRRQYHQSRNQYQDKLLSCSIGGAYTAVDQFLNNGGGILRVNPAC